jgi:hypothetical protein
MDIYQIKVAKRNVTTFKAPLALSMGYTSPEDEEEDEEVSV